MARINLDPIETAITITALQNYKTMVDKITGPDDQIVTRKLASDSAASAIESLTKGVRND